MIVPILHDETWQEKLASIPVWHPPAVSTLLVAPHPDDETLAAGALLASLRADGVPVSVVAVTDGENCYDDPEESRRSMGHLRTVEQTRALQTLGVAQSKVRRLRLADSGLHVQEDRLTQLLMEQAQDDMHLLAPWTGDFHPDHEACARAAATVARTKGLQLTYYFFWTWHRGDLSTVAGLPLRRFVPSADALSVKRAALREHRSQLERAGGDPILPPHLLGPAFWPFEVYLSA